MLRAAQPPNAVQNLMTPQQLQIVIDELQDVIKQTIDLMDRFEDREMQNTLTADYEKLHHILTEATQQQRLHMQALIDSQKTNNKNQINTP